MNPLLTRVLVAAAIGAFFIPTVLAGAASTDVPTAQKEIAATLDWMHSTRKSGGLGYSVAQAQSTHAYRALAALGGTWPAATLPPVTVPAGAVVVSPAGNDANCARNGGPCVTLTRADQIAQPGDTITVTAGAYSPQGVCDSFDGFTGCWYLNTPTPVTVTVTGPAALTGDLVFGRAAANITVTGPLTTPGRVAFYTGARNITVDGARMGDLFGRGAAAITVSHATIGGTPCYEPELQNDPDGTRNTGWAITNTTFAGFSVNATCPGKHLSCLLLEGMDGLTFAGNTCTSPAEGLLVKRLDSQSPTNLAITGNTFGVTSGGGAIYLSTSGGQVPEQWANVTVSGNTAAGSITVETAAATFSSVAVTGNNHALVVNGSGGCPVAAGLQTDPCG